MKKFVLTGGKIVTSTETFEGKIFVEGDKVVKVLADGQKGLDGQTGEDDFDESGFEIINVTGKYILPGLIDAHVHFRTPGHPEKEDWITGSKAALAGGVTTVLDMPNTNPPTVDAVTLEVKRALVQEQALVNYGFYAGAMMEHHPGTRQGERVSVEHNLEQVLHMKNIAGIKVYMGSSTGGLLVDDLNVLEEFMGEGNVLADGRKPILALHAESEQCIQEHMQELGAQEISVLEDPALHSKVRAPECAEQAVESALALAKKHGARVHVCHVSTGQELLLAQKYKEEPALKGKLSVEVTPHHLFLSEQDYGRYGNLVKVNPPMRSEKDVAALWQGIADGTVDMVATDHAPHLLTEKEGSSQTDSGNHVGAVPLGVPSGVPGVQTLLPLLLNAVNEGRLTLEKVVSLTSAGPARVFEIAGRGVLREGAFADITVVDMNLTGKVCHHFLWSKCGWSPFHGWVLQGWPVMTFVNGELMYQWRETFGSAHGREVEYGKQ